MNADGAQAVRSITSPLAFLTLLKAAVPLTKPDKPSTVGGSFVEP